MGMIFSDTDIRGSLGGSLTIEHIWNVGKAFAEWLPNDGAIVVQAAEDDAAVHALIEGVLLQGRNVLRASASDVTTLVAAIADNQAAGGVALQHETLQNLTVVTLLDEHGTPITGSLGLAEVNELVASGNFLPAPTKGTQQPV